MDICEAQSVDVPFIFDILKHYVDNTNISWRSSDELQLPNFVHKFEQRIAPWFVAKSKDDGGRVMGFAYVSHFRDTFGWRFCVENSVYVHHQEKGRGIGSALMKTLLQMCKEKGFRQIVSLISTRDGSDLGKASMSLHTKLGFVECGRMRNCGFKNDEWNDCVFMQKDLNDEK